jgi:hypothetical protein
MNHHCDYFKRYSKYFPRCHGHHGIGASNILTIKVLDGHAKSKKSGAWFIKIKIKCFKIAQLHLPVNFSK